MGKYHGAKKKMIMGSLNQMMLHLVRSTKATIDEAYDNDVEVTVLATDIILVKTRTMVIPAMIARVITK